MAYIVYILKCCDGSLYTGITNDLVKRLRAHNLGTASKYTRVRRPLVVVYSECAVDKGAALKRELQIKGLSRLEKLKIIETASHS
ncbi:MAG: GIY-YIG nuclease family protein [Proteobacteria bacterium]|nr:GIY-YIG nuclease family protein [Pseudomonadota bacterium]